MPSRRLPLPFARSQSVSIESSTKMLTRRAVTRRATASTQKAHLEYWTTDPDPPNKAAHIWMKYTLKRAPKLKPKWREGGPARTGCRGTREASRRRHSPAGRLVAGLAGPEQRQRPRRRAERTRLALVGTRCTYQSAPSIRSHRFGRRSSIINPPQLAARLFVG